MKIQVVFEVELPDDSDPSDAEIWAASMLEVACNFKASEHPYKPKILGSGVDIFKRHKP